MGKEGRRVNMMQKCVHMNVNAKMIPVETIQGIRVGRIKENHRGDELKYNIFAIL
jgi:hypothetical protein